METKLLHGDCLELLKTLPDCSVDAVVADPPYGLSNSVRDSLSDIFIPTLIDVFFPKFNNAIAKAGGSVNFSRPLDRVSFLNQVNRAFWKEARVGMPKCSVDLDSDIVDWNEEVKHADKPSVTVPNRELSDILDAHRLNNGNRFFLKLRACVNSSLGDSAAVGISEFGFGRLTVFVVIPFNSCFAGFLRSLSHRDSSGLAEIVRLLNDPQAFSESPASVVTGGGTELRTVLSFDVRSGTCEIKPANGTRKVDAVFEVVCPESVGTITGTSSLSSMFKPHSVSFIDSTANGTFSICFHSFIVPHINRESSGFMGKKWDCSVPSVEVWAECLRVLKPGGYLLAFAGTRTQHRMAVRIEDAGFEIRDMIAWVYGSGFPKSLDVSKAIDKAAGAEREVVGRKGGRYASPKQDFRGGKHHAASGVPSAMFDAITVPATEAAQRRQGWGTALKPAIEPITVARKPFKGTVAANVLEYSTGALNIDGCRIDSSGDKLGGGACGSRAEGWDRPWKNDPERYAAHKAKCYANAVRAEQLGRWPANLIHDGSEEVADLLGSAARFFYCPKASKADRDEGCEEMGTRTAGECTERIEGSGGLNSPRAGAGRTSGSRNFHPTVKPTALMRYLCRLVTPPGGVILDPFMGSGSTGKAAVLEGFGFVGIEREAEYIEIARARIGHMEGLCKNQ